MKRELLELVVRLAQEYADVRSTLPIEERGRLDLNLAHALCSHCNGIDHLAARQVVRLFKSMKSPEKPLRPDGTQDQPSIYP